MASSARISYSTTASGGIHLANFARYMILAEQELTRAYNIAVQVTAGGVTPANLEGSSEFGVTVGQGAVLQSAMIAFNSAVAALNTSVAANLSQVDPG